MDKSLVDRIDDLKAWVPNIFAHGKVDAILADVRELQDMLAEIVEADAKAVYELTRQGFPPEMAGPAMELANKARAILAKTKGDSGHV